MALDAMSLPRMRNPRHYAEVQPSDHGNAPAALKRTLGPEIARAVEWAVRATVEECTRMQRASLNAFREDVRTRLHSPKVQQKSGRYFQYIAMLNACDAFFDTLDRADAEDVLQAIAFRADAVERRSRARKGIRTTVPMAAMSPRMFCDPCQRVYYAAEKKEETQCPYCGKTAVKSAPLQSR